MAKLPEILVDAIEGDQYTWNNMKKMFKIMTSEGEFREPDGNWACYGYDPKSQKFGFSTIVADHPEVWLTPAEVLEQVGPLTRGFDGEF